MLPGFSIIPWCTDKLKQQRSPCYNPSSTWQKIPTDEIFKYRTLPRTLQAAHVPNWANSVITILWHFATCLTLLMQLDKQTASSGISFSSTWHNCNLSRNCRNKSFHSLQISELMAQSLIDIYLCISHGHHNNRTWSTWTKYQTINASSRRLVVCLTSWKCTTELTL